jgi:translation initiation factor IF-1
MSGAGIWKVEGVIVVALANGTYRARLANGHEVLAYVAGRAKLSAPSWKSGDKVNLMISAYDLSEARIVVERTQI